MKRLFKLIWGIMITAALFWYDGTAMANSSDRFHSSISEKTAALLQSVPRFYETYCTEDSSEALTNILTEVDAVFADEPESVERLADLIQTLSDGIDQLQFHSDSTIPQIYLATDDGSGNSFGTSLDKSHGYVSAQITVVDEHGHVIAKDTGWNGKVRVRGNTTAQGEKKPYNIRFSRKTNLFDMGEAKKWVLLADLYDPTLMRNYLALDFGKYLGLQAAPDFKRIEVWIDGVYRGVYLLTEKIEADQNRVNINGKKDSSDFLVELVFSGLREDDNTYLFTSSEKCFRLREPENVSQQKLNQITDELNHFEAILASNNWDRVSEVIDLQSFVAFYIQNEYFKTIDFADTSVYFYRKDGRYYGGPGWDFDLSAGNCNPEKYGEFIRSYEGTIASNAHYYQYLMKYPEFRLEVLKKYLAVDDYIHNIYKEGGYMDEQYEKFVDSFNRNNAIWFKGPERYIIWQKTPGSTYEENFEYLRNWLEQRDIWLADYFRFLNNGWEY